MELKTVDDALSAAGEFGRFQLLMLVLLSIFFFLSTEIIFTNFTAYDADHWCLVPQLSNLSQQRQKYIAIPYEKDEYSQCQVYNFNYSQYNYTQLLSWNRTLELEKHPEVRPVGCHSWAFDHSLFERTLTEKFNLVCSKKWEIDFITTVTIGGCLFGALIGGIIADRYGRKIGLQVALTCKIFGGLVAIFAPYYSLVLVGRVVVGFGSIMAYAVGMVLLLELVGAGYRSCVGMCLAIMYSLGFMFLSLVSYLLPRDDTFQLALTLPLIIAYIYPWIVPESPRWLILQKRHKEATIVLHGIGRMNRQPLPEGFDTRQLDMDVNYSSHKEQHGSPLDLIRTPQMRKRTLVLCFNWFTVSLIFYALSTNAGKLFGNIFLNTFLLGAVEIPANLMGVVLLGHRVFGRKYTQTLAFIVSGLALLACIPVQLTSGPPLAVTVLSLIGKAGSTTAFSALYVYTSELFPTKVRIIALGVCSTASRVSGMVSSFAGGTLGSVWISLPSLLFGVLGSLAGVATLLLPETLNKTLPETIEHVEKQSSPRGERHPGKQSHDDVLEEIDDYQPTAETQPLI